MLRCEIVVWQESCVLYSDCVKVGIHEEEEVPITSHIKCHKTKGQSDDLVNQYMHVGSSLRQTWYILNWLILRPLDGAFVLKQAGTRQLQYLFIWLTLAGL